MPQRGAASKVGEITTLEILPPRGTQPKPATADPEPTGPTLVDSILDKVVDCVDIDGLSSQLADRLAHRLGSAVSVDSLADAILSQHTEELSRRLPERLTERLARSMSTAGASKAAATCQGASGKEGK